MKKNKNVLQKFEGEGNTLMSQNNSDIPQYECCVMCGETTNVLVETPIDCRRFYIHGCGQLCEKCATIIKREE